MLKKSDKILAFNYFGGKYNFLNEIYSHFPEHVNFVDLMCGSLSVTLNKTPSKLDTANDIDGDVINFFTVLRNKPDELIQQLSLTPVHRQEYKNCFPIASALNDVDRARRFFVRCRMSFQGSGLSEHTGFNACIETTQGSVSKNVAKYFKSIEKLPAVIQRLQQIQFESLHYSAVVQKYDRDQTFFYVDPPYELRLRNYKKMYNNEFTDLDHRELSELLHQINGKAMVSHYDSKLYRELYKGWNFHEFKPFGHSMKKTDQKECIWTNY